MSSVHGSIFSSHYKYNIYIYITGLDYILQNNILRTSWVIYEIFSIDYIQFSLYILI